MVDTPIAGHVVPVTARVDPTSTSTSTRRESQCFRIAATVSLAGLIFPWGRESVHLGRARSSPRSWPRPTTCLTPKRPMGALRTSTIANSISWWDPDERLEGWKEWRGHWCGTTGSNDVVSSMLLLVVDDGDGRRMEMQAFMHATTALSAGYSYSVQYTCDRRRCSMGSLMGDE